MTATQTSPRYDRFTSERARRTSDRYGAHSVSLLALWPTKTTTTGEVSK